MGLKAKLRKPLSEVEYKNSYTKIARVYIENVLHDVIDEGIPRKKTLKFEVFIYENYNARLNQAPPIYTTVFTLDLSKYKGGDLFQFCYAELRSMKIKDTNFDIDWKSAIDVTEDPDTKDMTKEEIEAQKQKAMQDEEAEKPKEKTKNGDGK